jgi:hypothetical protein
LDQAEPRERSLDLAGFEAQADAFDRAVDSTPGVDRFCSRSDWVLSFHRAFAPERPLHLHRDGESFVVLAQASWPGNALGLEPLECMWGFACPLAGEQSPALLGRLTRAGGPLSDRRMLLTGLPSDGPLIQGVVEVLRDRYRGRVVSTTERCVASLEGGLDAWQARRSTAFRRNLRSAWRRVHAGGIRFERVCPTPGEVESLYARVIALERRSWKSDTGNGVAEGAMAEFYRQMWPRLARRGSLRVLFARDADGCDVGYLHGGMLGSRFRGLQFSFDETLRALGLGNVLQLEALEWLCEQGASLYDLGSCSAYKERWAERREVTLGLLVAPAAARG